MLLKFSSTIFFSYYIFSAHFDKLAILQEVIIESKVREMDGF